MVAVAHPAPTCSTANLAPTPAKSLEGPSPLLVIVGPTGSGKSALALNLAERFHGEIVCCDAVTVYQGLDIGSAKPTSAERARVPHHCLDLLSPDQPSTAGDYARAARQALRSIRDRRRLPILAGGSGLYLRATLDGLAPAPPRDEQLRERLRRRAAIHPARLHRILRRFDPKAAHLIHPNDLPKIIRSLETTLLLRRPQTEQWLAGRDPLQGFHTLQIALNPPRETLYRRLNERAEAMFSSGLLQETAALADTWGREARALGSLGYAQALQVLGGHLTLPDAIAAAQQGHRNYAKRQLTWFRRDERLHWLTGLGDAPGIQEAAAGLLLKHLNGRDRLGGDQR